MTGHDTGITVLGSTGAVGGLLTRLALDRGIGVTALVRDPARLPAGLAGHPGLTVVRGELADRDAVRRAVSGSGAVALAVGVRYRNGSMLKGIEGPVDVVPTAVRSVLAAAAVLGTTPRLVLLSALGVGDSWQQLPRVVRGVIGLTPVRHSYRQLGEAESLALSGPLPVHVVRPVRLTDGPATKRSADATGRALSGNPSVSRADVAALMLDLALDRGAGSRVVPAA